MSTLVSSLSLSYLGMLIAQKGIWEEQTLRTSQLMNRTKFDRKSTEPPGYTDTDGT